MPEGIEVKILTEYLNRKINGEIITDITINSGRYLKHKLPEGYKEFKSRLPLKILYIGSYGKFIYFHLEGDVYIFSTLGLTGVWQFHPDKHSHITLSLGKEKIYFSDMRNFGTIHFKFAKKELDKKLKTLGLNIMEPKSSFTFQNFKEKLLKKDELITKVLMNQRNFAGIGNYIKAESLYHSKISPHRTTHSLTDKEIRDLYEAIKDVVYRCYFDGSYYEIVDETGDKIEAIKSKDRELSYSDLGLKKKPKVYKFEVFHQDKDTKGNLVMREKTPDGRTTHWVPVVQK